jgi:hypothetical protein
MAGVRGKYRKRLSPTQRELTAKQAEFVRQYVVDLNATAAAKRAGYKNANKGRQLVTKSNIARALAEALQARSARTQLTADEVIEGLRREANDRSEGSQHSARVRAWETLARMGGYLPDSHLHRHQHRHQQELPISPSKITLSSQEVIDKLPLETRLQILEAVRAAQEEAKAKAVAKLTHSAQPVEPNGEPNSSAPIEPTALVIDTTAQGRKPIPERREQSR